MLVVKTLFSGSMFVVFYTPSEPDGMPVETRDAPLTMPQDPGPHLA